MNLTIEARRFKQLREELGMTQAAFADTLGIGPTTADIERGRVKISAQALKELFRQYNINPLWLFGESFQKYLNAGRADVSPQLITVDNSGNENILLVSVKAAAGYGENLGDRSYYEQLPAFTFPLPEYRNASFRGFQVSGDSMYPFLKPGEWVMAKAVNSLEELRSESIYVVAEKESVRIKKIRKTADHSVLELISLNPDYPPVLISASDVLEIWQYHSKISFGEDDSQERLSLEDIYAELKYLNNVLRERK